LTFLPLQPDTSCFDVLSLPACDVMNTACIKLAYLECVQDGGGRIFKSPYYFTFASFLRPKEQLRFNFQHIYFHFFNLTFLARLLK
jgi:hypothetical protein